MGGGGSSKKKSSSSSTTTTTPPVGGSPGDPKYINPFMPIGGATTSQAGSFMPIIPPEILQQLGMAFDPQFVARISAPISLPPLPKSSSTHK